MDSKPSKNELRSQLEQTANTMSSRFASIQDEVASTGSSVRDWVKAHPLESVGGMLAAGLVVGLLFGGTTRKRRRRHQKLIDQYLDALTDEIEEAGTKGEKPSKALETALRDRVPLVVYADDERPQKSGALASLFGDSFRVLMRTAVSLVARDAIEKLLEDTDLDQIIDDTL